MDTTGASHSSRKDFDFLEGSWIVHNRYLRERLVDSDIWDEFQSSCVMQLILDGMGNQDEFRIDYSGGYIGMSFRFFDPSTKQWAIYWADSRRPGLLDPPVIGTFSGDTGVFRGGDTFQGRPIVVRFIWSRVTTGAPRWEQAFSADGGATWETNWIMDFEGRNVPSVEAKEIQPETVLGLHREKGDPGLGHPARDSKEVTSRAPGAFNEL